VAATVWPPVAAVEATAAAAAAEVEAAETAVEVALLETPALADVGTAALAATAA
jgi:hypothetical protein